MEGDKTAAGSTERVIGGVALPFAMRGAGVDGEVGWTGRGWRKVGWQGFPSELAPNVYRVDSGGHCITLAKISSLQPPSAQPLFSIYQKSWRSVYPIRFPVLPYESMACGVMCCTRDIKISML